MQTATVNKPLKVYVEMCIRDSLKALRLNLVGLLAPRVYKVFQTFEKNKRRPGHSTPHEGEAKSWPSCSSADDLYFVCITLHERGFPLGKPWC